MSHMNQFGNHPSLGPKGDFKGKLLFYFFKAGTDPLSFEPDNIHYIEKLENGGWSNPVPVAQPGEVIWQVQHAGSNLYTSSYIGKTYQFELPADINLHFNKSRSEDLYF